MVQSEIPGAGVAATGPPSPVRPSDEAQRSAGGRVRLRPVEQRTIDSLYDIGARLKTFSDEALAPLQAAAEDFAATVSQTIKTRRGQ